MYSTLTWPAGSGQDASAFDQLYKISEALWERSVAATSGAPYPKPHPPWESGTVAGVTVDEDGNYVIDCGTNNGYPYEWVITVGGMSNVNRWVGYTPPDDAPGIPTAYDIVLEGDPRKSWLTVRGPVIGQYPNSADGGAEGAARTVTVAPALSGASSWGLAIQHALVGGYLSSLSSLVGRKWYIIKRGGMWSSDRVPERPNDHEAWAGSCSGGQVNYPTISDTLYSYVQDSDPATQWTPEQWIGLELLAFAGSALKRVTVVHNDKNRLYFAAADWTGGGAFSVVVAGSKGVPGRAKWRPQAWYRGAADAYYTHDAGIDGVAATCLLAASKVYWNEFNVDAEICESIGHPEAGSVIGPTTALDQDLIIHSLDYGTKCDAGKVDDFAAPHIHKSFRHWQKTLLDLGPYYVRTLPTGSTDLTYYYPAELLTDMGLPSGSASLYRDGELDEDDNTATFDVGQAGIDTGYVYYTVYKDGLQYAGYAAVAPDGKVRAVGFSTPADPEPDDATDAGLSVKWAVPYKRYYPRRVRYLYPRTCWQPDLVYGVSGSSAKAPPGPTQELDGDGYPTGNWLSEGCGYYERRGKSTNYAEFDDYGQIHDSGPVFVSGDLVRVEGDNTGGPSFDALYSASNTDPTLPYRDLFYRGTYAVTKESIYHSNRKGKATGGGSNRLTDTVVDWWSDGVNGGTHATHTYAALAGGATSVTLAIDGEDKTNPEWTWFDSRRFVQTPSGKPYVDMTLHVTRAGVEHRYVVTDCTTTGGVVVLSFAAEAGFLPDAGDTVTLREPKYTPNKFEGRALTLTSPAGAKYTAVVTHNDDHNIWFGDVKSGGVAAGPLTIAEDWQYEIDYIPPGTVLRRTADGWQLPTGSDSARLGVSTPAPFLAAAANNLPTYVKAYGLHRRGDRIIDNTMLRELYAGINLLLRTTGDYGWVNQVDPETPEDNGSGGDIFGLGENNEYPHWSTIPDDDGLNRGRHSTPAGAAGQLWDQTDPAKYPNYGLKQLLEFGGPAGGPPYSTTHYSVLAIYFANGYQVGTYSRYGGEQRYAYGAYDHPAVPIGCTATACVYGQIDMADSPDGYRFITEEERPYQAHTTPELTVIESNKFDARGTPLSYRSWTTYTTFTPAVGVASNRNLGPKFGGPGITQPVTVVPPPPDVLPAYEDQSTDATVGGANAVGAGNTGYVVAKKALVREWDFVFKTGTW